MDIYKLTIHEGDDIYYSKSFMDTLESHLDYFRKSSLSNTLQVDTKKAHIYEGDLFGYLNDIGIDQKYHWLVMRINDLYCSNEFDQTKYVLIVPSYDEVDQIRSAHTATGAITS
jgi:hypothetical protein